MKRIAILFTLLLGVAASYGQSGAEVLARVGENFAAMDSYRIDFELEMSSATDSSKGYCLISEPLYLISIDGADPQSGMKQGFDGQKMWMFDGISREIVYDNHKSQSHSLFENPTKAFDFSEDLFAVVGVEDGEKGVWSITLRPKAGVLDGIEYVVLEVDKKSLLPTRLGYDMAGAGIYIRIAKITPVEASPDDFTVTPPDGFEVIDFR